MSPIPKTRAGPANAPVEAIKTAPTRRPGPARRSIIPTPLIGNQLGRQLRIADRASTNRSVGLFELPRFSG